jgi:hypothetical protein
LIIQVVPHGAPTPDPLAIGTITRDALHSDHLTGYDSDVQQGFALGVSVLVLELGVALAAFAAGVVRRY